MHGFVEPAFQACLPLRGGSQSQGSSITEKAFLPGLYMHEQSPAETNPYFTHMWVAFRTTVRAEDTYKAREYQWGKEVRE